MCSFDGLFRAFKVLLRECSLIPVVDVFTFCMYAVLFVDLLSGSFPDLFAVFLDAVFVVLRASSLTVPLAISFGYGACFFAVC